MPDGTIYVGSGWLASFKGIVEDKDWINHVIMTSGHCVFAGKSWAKTITVIPGRYGDNKPYGEFVATKKALRASKEWEEDSLYKSNYDYGAILIPKIYKPNWGAMPFINLPDSDLEKSEVINTGYPADKDIGTMWTANGPITEVEKYKIKYMNDTYGGQSGSPAYLDDQVSKVVGIHGYGGCPNKAVRLTENVINDMKKWATED
ncbi:trypsin-like serine peptidase [Dapis sp. BLCC M126]|uniref:trypsin-like serine peptidase n=1 Tax=Dapis sp. BLCC M126 TaxID=3400189 RepID=UPI003CEB1E6A